MAGGNFMARVISYVVNEVVVNGLANSPAFQRFAVRTSKRLEDLSSTAASARAKIVEQVEDMSKNFDETLKLFGEGGGDPGSLLSDGMFAARQSRPSV